MCRPNTVLCSANSPNVLAFLDGDVLKLQCKVLCLNGAISYGTFELWLSRFVYMPGPNPTLSAYFDVLPKSIYALFCCRFHDQLLIVDWSVLYHFSVPKLASASYRFYMLWACGIFIGVENFRPCRSGDRMKGWTLAIQAIFG